MENLKSNLCAYADFLDENQCEFILIARDGETETATALMSNQSIGMLAGIFEKCPYIYQLFKAAESCIIGTGNVCGN